jgi:hypothetical protein
MTRPSLLLSAVVDRPLATVLVWVGIACALGGLAVASLRPARAQAEAAEVLIVGDSLAVGMKPFLREMIPDRKVTVDARAGRTTPQGMEALRLDLQYTAPQTVVISLGTNDGSDAKLFGDRVRRMLLDIDPDTCIVWPAIIRPPRKGDYRGLNKVLRREARRDRRMTIIPWDRMVSKGTVSLRDGVHPNSDGYRYRAYVTAAAVDRGCG